MNINDSGLYCFRSIEIERRMTNARYLNWIENDNEDSQQGDETTRSAADGVTNHDVISF